MEFESEFFKLDHVDRKLLFWMMDHTADAIPSWLEFVTEEYRSKKNIEIDRKRLQREVEEELDMMKPK